MDFTRDEIQMIMQLTDRGFRMVAQEAGIDVMAEIETLKSALNKLQALYDMQGAEADQGPPDEYK